MLPPPLLRASAVSSRALRSSKPYLSRQNSLSSSSSPSCSKKRMEGGRTPDAPPPGRRPSYGRGSALIAIEKQKVAEKEAETQKKIAISEAEKNAQVSRILMEQILMEKDSHKRQQEIENEMYLAREKSQTDASFYRVMKEAEANKLKLTPEYLELKFIEAIANNSKIFFGDNGSSGKSSISRVGSGSCTSSNVDLRGNSPHSNRPLQRQTSPKRAMGSSNMRALGSPESDLEVSSGKSSISLSGGSSNSSNVDLWDNSPQSNRPQQRQTSQERAVGSSNARGPESDPGLRPFDICRTGSKGSVKLKNSILEQNREKRRELENTKKFPQPEYLRSGMILLKKFISHSDQVIIIERCRELGIGVGGFYRLGYRDGAKLQLQMMCLGKNLDPESRLYEDQRPFDGAKPPKIPEEFKKLVDGAIQSSHDLLRQQNGRVNVEDELPRMSPDICIVNFYSNNGRLGLHQDKDESKESLDKGLPVVSFSLGDSAEFLYGDKRDVDLADKVVLESGDILIFGGKSRHLFHGVSTVVENTAPKRLLDETKLRPGRLNLTFRQY